MDLNGAQILVQSLEEQKVEVVFGYPGGAVLEIIDALQESSIKQVLVRHEQGEPMQPADMLGQQAVWEFV